MTYRIELTRAAKNALTEGLPEAVAVACWEFIRGPLAENPHRVGKPLRDQLGDRYSARRGEFRIVYEILDELIIVRIVHIAHRRDVYR